MKYRIHGILTTQAPMHIAAPGNMRFDPATGSTAFGDTGIPCTGIHKMPCAVRENGSDSELFRFPVIAGNNIAGRLRRHVARLVLNAFKRKGQKLTLQTYSVLMCGAATSNPGAQEMTFSEYTRVVEHPYLGLMGGGPKMLHRKARVHNALPVNEVTNKLRGKLCHPAANDYVQQSKRLTAAWAFRHNDDLRQMADMDLAEATIDNFHQVFNARQVAILEENKNNKEGTGGSLKTTTRTYAAIEFVVPGVNFDLLFELDVNTDAQVGLFLSALDTFARDEMMGGWSRNGFGAFTLNDVRLLDETDQETLIFNDGKLIRNEPNVAKYLSAWATAADNLDAAELEALVKVPEAKPAKEKKTA